MINNVGFWANSKDVNLYALELFAKKSVIISVRFQLTGHIRRSLTMDIAAACSTSTSRSPKIPMRYFQKEMASTLWTPFSSLSPKLGLSSCPLLFEFRGTLYHLITQFCPISLTTACESKRCLIKYNKLKICPKTLYIEPLYTYMAFWGRFF